jgi:hypothetical protein
MADEKDSLITAEARAAWEAYRTALPTSADIEGIAFRNAWFDGRAFGLAEGIMSVAQPDGRNAWFDGRAFGLVEGIMSVAQPDGQAYAQGIAAGRAEERERCEAICRRNMDEWNTEGDGWFSADEILREIKAG